MPKRSTVTVVDHNSGKKYRVVLPIDVPVRRLVPELVKHLNLPANGAGGGPQEYYLLLDAPDGTAHLGEDETLEEAGIEDGATIRITPHMTGG